MENKPQEQVESNRGLSVASRRSKEHSEVVASWLMIYAQNYREEVTEELALLYHQALSDIKPEILHKAFLRAARTNKFRPTPAEVRIAAEIEYELVKQIEPQPCEKCRDTGWVVSEADNWGYRRALLCDCRKKAQ